MMSAMKKKLLVTLLGLSALGAQPALADTATSELAKDATFMDTRLMRRTNSSTTLR